jgi:amino acid adenylation domain-containing protein
VTDAAADQKRQLLARLLKEKKREMQATASKDRQPSSSARLRVQSVARVSNPELSFAQERIWFLEQLQPESLFYNVFERFGFSGCLDAELLRRSIEVVVGRHDVLRSTYSEIGGRPVQRIQPPSSWELQFFDLRKTYSEDRDLEVWRLLTIQAKTRFDLVTGPLLRTALLQLEDQEFVLALTVHHIAIDGWSLRLLMHEIAACYLAFVEERPTLLPDVSLQYSDFAHWQRHWLTGDVLESHRKYWFDQLGKRPPNLDLPTDHVRPANRTFAAETYYAVVPFPVITGLRELSRREGVTLFTTLLAAFSTLMMRYTGQDDFVMGSLIAGRVRPEVEHMLGCFINTLALRMDLSGNPTFREMIARTRDVVFGAHSHEAYPFERLVEDIKPERGLSSNPLAQVFLNMLNFWKREEILLPGLRFFPIGGLDVHAVADGITLFVSEGQEHADFCYAYSSELFESATIERMAAHFSTLLEGVVAKPDEHIWDIPLLPEAERNAIEDFTVGTGQSFPTDAPLHRLFEDQARSRPDAVAVSFKGLSLSYAEVNSRANLLAQRLHEVGIGPDDLVGLCVDRSPELIIGILGILKAGGAYVPLDPRDPEDRLSFILTDTAARVLVTQKAVQASLPALSDIDLVVLEEVLANPDATTTANSDGGAGPNNLAYVIYTSGSTGQPKGVLVTHANVVRLLAATELYYNFTSEDVWPLFHSFAFDVSVWELWGALAYGGRLVVVPYITSRDPDAFLQLILQEHVTVLNQTPSAFRLLMEADRKADPPVSTALRLIIFAGEALDIQSLRPWFQRHGDSQPKLVNMYGITETCVHVTYRPITWHDVEANVGSVIGVPMPDLRITLLDNYGHLVPFGVPGEIYVGGPGLARGYLNRPQLTAQRFIADPKHPGERLYRSGDLARREPNGELKYLGRIDQQVKIRGFRVELGEIEAALGEHPNVRESVVVVRASAGGDRLTGYVVPAAGNASSLADELRTHLKRKLPPYMIPQAIVLLPALPLNRNGKIDRRALPELEPEPDNTSGPCRKLTPTEERLAHIWCELLGAKSIGANDNFFEKGGQSLLAVRMVARAREAFGIDLSVSRLFEFQSLADLASHVDAERTASALRALSGSDTKIPALTRVPRDSVRRASASAE